MQAHLSHWLSLPESFWVASSFSTKDRAHRAHRWTQPPQSGGCWPVPRQGLCHRTACVPKDKPAVQSARALPALQPLHYMQSTSRRSRTVTGCGSVPRTSACARKRPLAASHSNTGVAEQGHQVLGCRTGCALHNPGGREGAETSATDLREGSKGISEQLFIVGGARLLPLLITESHQSRQEPGSHSHSPAGMTAQKCGDDAPASSPIQTKLPIGDTATSRRASRLEQGAQLVLPPLSPLLLLGDAAPCSGICHGVAICGKQTRQHCH